MHIIVVKSVELHCGFLPVTSYEYTPLLLKFVKLPAKQKGSAEHPIGVSCVELLVGNNATNKIMNELFYCSL